MIYRIMLFTCSIGVLAALSACSDATGVSRETVATIQVQPSNPTLGLGGSLPLSVEVKDATGRTLSDRTVIWSSNNTDIVSVTSTGVITAHRVGSAQVAASSEGRSALATITVQATRVASVVVSPSRPDVSVGASTKLDALMYDANGAVLADRAAAWSSGNTNVATVDNLGVVRGVSPGTATITATSEGITGESVVTVIAVPVASVIVTPAPTSVTVNQSRQLTATVRDAAGNTLTGRTVTWSSSNTNIATVTPTGVVTGRLPGMAVITATSEGRSGSSEVTVTAVAVNRVVVAPKTATIPTGGTRELTATPQDASGAPLTGRQVTWSTNNPGVATVSPEGVVTGVSAGTARITANVEGQSDFSDITVQAPTTSPTVTRVTISPKPLLMQSGQEVDLTATAYDANNNVITGRSVTWSSDRANVANVNANGRLRASQTGAATITATIDGVTDQFTVTVVP